MEYGEWWEEKKESGVLFGFFGWGGYFSSRGRFCGFFGSLFCGGFGGFG